MPVHVRFATGLSFAVMAWMPCRVPARTRYSLLLRRPASGIDEALGWVKCSHWKMRPPALLMIHSEDMMMMMMMMVVVVVVVVRMKDKRKRQRRCQRVFPS